MEDIWPIDGKDHKVIGIDQLYKDQKISDFLRSDSRTYLIAAKGMGKTLLMRTKKYLMQKESGGELIIPRNAEADYPQLRGSISGKGLESIELWEEAWTIALILSALSHRHIPEENISRNRLNSFIDALDAPHIFKQKILEDIKSTQACLPSHYLSSLFELSLGELRKLNRSAHNIDTISHHYITDGCCIFIDAFDQTLTDKFRNNLPIWRNAQIGLLKASYRITVANPHIKIYVSIRQEAWSAFESDDREVIKGRAVILEYKKRQLKEMFEYAIGVYTKYQTITQFLGVEKIYNKWKDEYEECFGYIYRHCVPTPRSVMAFGAALHQVGLNSLPAEERNSEIRDVINDISSDQLYDDYLISQRQIFLDTLSSEKKLNYLLKILPSNVLRGKTLTIIRRKFSENFDDLDEGSIHPFSELLNIGVLGTVDTDAATGDLIQTFRKPYEFDWRLIELTNQESTFLIHSSLHKKITRIKGDESYYLNPSNIIGDTRSWENKQKNIFPLVFISHSSTDKSRVEEILSILEPEVDLQIPIDVWYDKKSIKAGEHIHRKVEKGVSESDLVIVFVTASSLQSGWVDREWRSKHSEEIAKNKIQVICVMLDNTRIEDLPEFLGDKKCVFLAETDQASGVTHEINDLVIGMVAALKNQ